MLDRWGRLDIILWVTGSRADGSGLTGENEDVTRIVKFMGRWRSPEKEPDKQRINEKIRISPVRVIGADGSQLGVLPTEEALQTAREDGLDLVRRLLLDVPRLLRRGGMALLEIEAGQGADALSFVCANLENMEAGVLEDLTGRDRLLEIRIL